VYLCVCTYVCVLMRAYVCVCAYVFIHMCV
jgi:hypothetical protein